MFKLVQISVQMLGADLVVCADNGTLKQAPNALNAVCVDVPANPFFRAMVDALMARVFVGNAVVSRPFVRRWGQSMTFDIWSGI